MGTIIFSLIVICIGIALFKRIWPLIVLGVVIWLVYLFPVPTISIIAVLALLGYWADSSSKKDFATIEAYLEEKGMLDVDQIASGTSISETAINTALEKLVEINKVEKVELKKGEFLYKSHNYKAVSKTTEIELD
ncbi:hypothetical protein [Vibrio cyclitrophicus]|uniref:hypothetical protein n=1 Tax=Vibrio cyclitrophicus TaxID=47951 RepID=UPI00067E733F|nr:hypothetical protein [Vibrio cyclitrophicus]KNH14447.1 hypothetical protein ACS79_03490 [Vibrio lentus]PMH39176.1 hypothetical protein BCU69_19360 [Vibrio cyclitrophicus]